MTSLARLGLAAAIAICLPGPPLSAQDMSEAELRAVFARQMQKFQEARQQPGLGTPRGLVLNRVKPAAETDKGAVAATEVTPAPPVKLTLTPPTAKPPADTAVAGTSAPAGAPSGPLISPARIGEPDVAATTPAETVRPTDPAATPPTVPEVAGTGTGAPPPAVVATQPAKPAVPTVAATESRPTKPTPSAVATTEPQPAKPAVPTVAATESRPTKPTLPAVATTEPQPAKPDAAVVAERPETVSPATLSLAAARPAPTEHVTLPPEDQVNVRVQFDFDSAAINADQKPKLRTFCKVMDEMNIRLFRIVGHTDASGTATYNQKLSLLRAEEVKRFFTDDCGIAAERLEAIGVGEQFLADPQDPRAGENRRVEFQAIS